MSLLGNAYMADGKPELVLQQFEKAVALDPQNPTIKTRVAISEIDAGQRELGLAQLERLFASGSAVSAAGPTLLLTHPARRPGRQGGGDRRSPDQAGRR